VGQDTDMLLYTAADCTLIDVTDMMMIMMGGERQRERERVCVCVYV